MKKILGILLILIFILPTFVPWMPQGVVQVLHSQEHHQPPAGVSHEESHHDIQASIEHDAHFDIATYFSDYLHVDLKKPDAQKLSAFAPDVQTIDYALLPNILSPSVLRISIAQITSPTVDDWRILHRGMPVYLATQRLRI